MNQSNAYDAGYSMGTVVAFIVIYGGIIALGWYFGRLIGRKREEGSFARWPLGLAVAVDLVLLAGQCSAPIKAQTATNVPKDDIVVQLRIVGKAANFPHEPTLGMVKRYNEGVHDGVVDNLRAENIELSPESVLVSTEVVTLGGRKIFKSKITFLSRLFMYQFAGISGANALLVTCVSRTAHPFEANGTLCEQPVRQAFGT
jgi:hypothetical protein